MNAPLTLTAWVHTLSHAAQDILSVELRPEGVNSFPGFEPGAHIDLQLPNGMVRSYSLCNDSRETHRYVLGILKDRNSRGGSRCVHEQLRVGMRLMIGAPRNNFPLHAEARHSVLLAGGIGITPILCMARALQVQGQSVEVIYCARNRQSMAYADELISLGIAVTWHLDDEVGGPPDLKTLLAAHPGQDETHYYACGPAVMLNAFEKTCAELGYDHAHIERFTAIEVKAAADALKSFTVELRRSGKTFEVTPDTDLHKMLLACKADVPFSCEEGICGSCETRVLEGKPDHRDSVLTAAEQATNRVMMVCVSGCKSERLVLDL
jgi:ferredoxin-NADP reductase